MRLATALAILFGLAGIAVYFAIRIAAARIRDWANETADQSARQVTDAQWPAPTFREDSILDFTRATPADDARRGAGVSNLLHGKGN